jgi:PAS domain S-box-containing protein
MTTPEQVRQGLPPVDLATLDLLPDPAWVTTSADGVAYFNAAWRTMTGSIPRVLDIETFLGFVHPDDRSKLRAAWRLSRQKDTPFVLECRLRRADGAFHWFLMRAVAVPHEDGQAEWLGSIIDIDAERRAREALIASEARARSIANAIPQLIGITAPDGALVSVNDTYTAFTGKTMDDLGREGWTALIHPDDLDGLCTSWQRAVRERKPYDTQYRLLRRDGVYRWFLNKAIPLRDAAGTLTGWIGTATDIDERKRTEDALRVIVDASSALADTLDPTVALQRLADVAVTHLADWCGVHVYVDGALRAVAIAHRDPSKVRFVRDYLRRYPIASDDPAALVAATGIPLRVDDIVPEMYDAIDDDEQRALARSVGLRSVLYVPLGGEREHYGVLSLALAESKRRFTDEDVQLATLIAQRGAIAVGNARLYERQREVARTLQAAFLPPALPQTDNVAFDAAYAPGTRDLTIGGDWYDAFRLDGGIIAFSVGDVAGHGLEAAVPMGKMRQTFRALGVIDADPAWSISVADSVLRREHPDVFVTAFVATYEPALHRLEYANAGHPAPFVRGADGALSRIEASGVPLGLGAFDVPRTWEKTLSPGDLLVAFTDGLIESTRDIDEGERVVAAALEHPAFGVCTQPAALLRAMVVPDEPGDDVAILTLHVGPGPDWSFDANDARAAQAARKAFVARLRAAGVAEEDRVACEIVFGEIVGNVARYTPGRVDVALLREGNRFRLAALDRGPGFRWNAAPPPDQLAESGRGLFLIGTLSRGVRVESIAGFGSYVEVLLAADA